MFDKNGLYDIPKKDFKTKENGHNETTMLKPLNLFRKVPGKNIIYFPK